MTAKTLLQKFPGWTTGQWEWLPWHKVLFVCICCTALAFQGFVGLISYICLLGILPFWLVPCFSLQWADEGVAEAAAGHCIAEHTRASQTCCTSRKTSPLLTGLTFNNCPCVTELSQAFVRPALSILYRKCSFLKSCASSKGQGWWQSENPHFYLTSLCLTSV